MNGSEYKALFALTTEARDEAKACGVILDEHCRRLGALEKKVDANVAAVLTGRVGLRVVGWVGGVLVALGGLTLGVLKVLK